MKTQEELSSEEMGRTIVRLHNEIVEKDRGIALLKEQLRVADVAYQYLFEEHKKAQAYVKKMEHVLQNGGINPEAL